MDYVTCVKNQCRVFVYGVKYYSEQYLKEILTLEKISNICFVTKTTVSDYMYSKRNATDYFYITLSKHFNKSYDDSIETFNKAKKIYQGFLKYFFLFEYDKANIIAKDFLKNNNYIFSIASTFYLFFSYYIAIISDDTDKTLIFQNLIEKHSLLDQSMFIFYLILKSEHKHNFDSFSLDLDTNTKINVIEKNEVLEERLVISYFKILYSWSNCSYNTYYKNLLTEFRDYGYLNFYFVLLCKEHIYNLKNNNLPLQFDYECLENLYLSLNGKYNEYFFKILKSYYLLIQGNVEKARDLINYTNNYNFFDITILKLLLDYLFMLELPSEDISKIKSYYLNNDSNHPTVIRRMIKKVNKST